MTSIRDLVVALPGRNPGNPRLTWYGGGQERVELSGRVLVNGVVKATNLLVSDCDVGPGVRVALHLPAHWRALVWALATWTAGAELVVLPPDRVPGDGRGGQGELANGSWEVLVTDRPPDGSRPHPAGVVVAVALPALALRFPTPLPAGAVDGAADLMSYPDALGWLPQVEVERPALVAPGGVPPVTHADLLTWARATAGAEAWPGSPRVLLVDPTPLDLLAHAVAALALDGSLVLVQDQRTDLDHLVHQERVTVRR